MSLAYQCLIHQINVKPIRKLISNMINSAGTSSVYNKKEAVKYIYIYIYIYIHTYTAITDQTRVQPN